MPRSTAASRPAHAPAALPESSLPADEPPAAARPGEAKEVQLLSTPVLRVGEYEVGDGYCPRLHGHPGIRY